MLKARRLKLPGEPWELESPCHKTAVTAPKWLRHASWFKSSARGAIIYGIAHRSGYRRSSRNGELQAGSCSYNETHFQMLFNLGSNESVGPPRFFRGGPIVGYHWTNMGIMTTTGDPSCRKRTGSDGVLTPMVTNPCLPAR